MTKKEKPESLIGKTFNNGKLKVVGIHGKSHHNTTFRVVCDVCSKDTELFPFGYFVATKASLKAGRIPCGCSKKHHWEEFQFLIRANREAKSKGFDIECMVEDFHGVFTKLRCRCQKDGHVWISTFQRIINQKSICPACAGNPRRTEESASSHCIDACREIGYTFIGFIEGYKDKNSHFEYECPKHGIQNASYHNFIYHGSRCAACAREYTGFNGWYPHRAEEQDFLYVVNFDNQFIKVGRSFDIDDRIIRLASLSKIKNITKLHIYTATHKEVYDFEQEILEDLRDRGFQYSLGWTNECFDKDCLFVLNKILDMCDYNRVY